MSSLLSTSLFWSTGAMIGSQATLRVLHHRRPRPMPHQFAAALDHPLRLRYRDPVELLGLLGFMAGMHVLDLGCGTGLFTLPMARMVGEGGQVHAVDLQAPLLDVTRRRLDDAGLVARLRLHHAGAYGLPLADESIDLAVAIAVLPQIPDRVRALHELRRVLKPGARLAISEEMPDPAYVPPNVTRYWAESAGFHFKAGAGNPFCYTQVYLKTEP